MTYKANGCHPFYPRALFIFDVTPQSSNSSYECSAFAEYRHYGSYPLLSHVSEILQNGFLLPATWSCSSM